MWMRLLTAVEEKDGSSGGKRRLFWSLDVGGCEPVSVECGWVCGWSND